MLYVIAKIDEQSEAKLEQIQKIATQFGIEPKPLHGHITLVTYQDGNEAELIAHCKKILRNQKAFSVFYDKIEVLSSTSIIVASPKNEGALQSVQNRLTTEQREHIAEWTRADVWHPHTTLIFDAQADLDAIAQAMEEVFESFEASIECIQFSKETENGYEIVDFVELEK